MTPEEAKRELSDLKRSIVLPRWRHLVIDKIISMLDKISITDEELSDFDDLDDVWADK